MVRSRNRLSSSWLLKYYKMKEHENTKFEREEPQLGQNLAESQRVPQLGQKGRATALVLTAIGDFFGISSSLACAG